MVIEIIASDPRFKEILKNILEYAKKHGDMDFRYHEIGLAPNEVQKYIPKLIRLGIIQIASKPSRGANYYKVVMPVEQLEILIKQADKFYKKFKEKRSIEKPVSKKTVKKHPIMFTEDLSVPKEIVDQLFTSIEGLDKQKKIIKMALLSPYPQHLLLIGPPATSKSLILLDIYENIPTSMYILGSTSSKAGIRDLLLENRPQILLVDEIDKMDKKDMDILLSIMTSGLIVETKHTIRTVEKMWIKVFGACNDASRLTKALLSRFLPVEFPEYSDEEYIKVVVSVLKSREKIPEKIGKLIASELVKYTKDPRDAIQIARMVKNMGENEVREVIKILIPSIKKKYELLKWGRMRY